MLEVGKRYPEARQCPVRNIKVALLFFGSVVRFMLCYIVTYFSECVYVIFKVYNHKAYESSKVHVA
jgi:hypothetical protein